MEEQFFAQYGKPQNRKMMLKKNETNAPKVQIG